MVESKVKEFNRIAKELCVDISRKYDTFVDVCEETVGKIDEGGENEGKFYLDYYVKSVLPHIDILARCDEEECFKRKVYIMDDVSLRHIFNSGISAHNKQIMWKYLHSLYVLFQAIPNVRELYPDACEYLDKKDEIIKEIVKSRKRLTEAMEAEQKEMEDNIKKMEDKVKESFGDDVMNSSIGSLAKEIGEEIDLKDLEDMNNPAELFSALFSGGKGGNDKINNLFGKVGEKLSQKMKNGEIDEQKLFAEATNMMSGLGGLFGAGGGGKGAGGMPDLSKMMSNLGGLGGLANMMGGMNSRKMSRKMEKKAKSMDKKHTSSKSKKHHHEHNHDNEHEHEHHKHDEHEHHH